MGNSQPADTRWRDKRGRAALEDWKTWVFALWIAVAVMVTLSLKQDHGWVIGLLGFVLLMGAEVGALTVWKRRRRPRH